MTDNPTPRPWYCRCRDWGWAGNRRRTYPVLRPATLTYCTRCGTHRPTP